MFQILLIVFIMLAFINVPLCRKMVVEFHRQFPQIEDKILSSAICFHDTVICFHDQGRTQDFLPGGGEVRPICRKKLQISKG